MSTQRALCVASIVTLLAFAGCDGDVVPTTANLSGLPLLGELHDMCQASTALDSDGDFLPDDIEFTLGTNHQDRDTDRDGLPDNFEVFGEGIFDPNLFVPDMDGDGLIAPRDSDDDGDLMNDGLSIDTDGDGVANYLEFYGYTYDWLTGRFVSCEDIDCTGRTIYRSDPLQRSTDQDAYSDGMEVSRLSADVAVRDPGNHPLVPALPNIVVQLAGYQVTLNDDITYEEGGSVTKGYSWSRQTESSHSTTHSISVEVGAETGYDDGFVAKGHLNVGWSMELGHTTSSSVAVGGTVDEEINWNRARSHNPTQAALLKLMLKVENRGTAPVSNLVPTINLSIGGANVATFRPANLQINLLMPGETFPAGPSDYWVFDTTENGPLMLTDWELRALESGAPVRISVSQVDGDVMRLTENGWDSVGAVGEYMKRCEAVCATLFADLGDGAFMHHRVYAAQGPSTPVVTLRDALRWTMGASEQGDDVFIEHVHPNGTREQVRLTEPGGEGWSVHMDKMSYDRLDPDGKLLDLRLKDDSHIELISPRESTDGSPTIYSAYAIPLDGGYRVVACAYDYDGIESVVLVDRDGEEHEMTVDGRGPWFFSCNLPQDYEFLANATEYVKVTSVNDSVATEELDVEIIHTVISLPPSLGQLIYDPNQRKLQVKATAGTSLPQDAIAEGGVRLYHPDFPSSGGTQPSGYVVMNPTIYWFEEPDVYEVVLPVNGQLEALEDYPGCRVVASSVGGQHTVIEVKNVATVTPYGYGDFLMDAWTDFGNFTVQQIRAPYVWLDQSGKHYPRFPKGSDGYYYPADGGWSVLHQGGWPADELEPFAGITGVQIYIRNLGDYGHATHHRIGFMPGCEGGPMSPVGEISAEVYFEELTRSDVVAASGAFTSGVTHKLEPGKVYGFRTASDRWGKVLVKTVKVDLHKFLLVFPGTTDCRVQGRYVIFKNP